MNDALGPWPITTPSYTSNLPSSTKQLTTPVASFRAQGTAFSKNIFVEHVRHHDSFS
jgi:hypothetical protein